MTQLIWDLYPAALDCDISPFSFWESSIDEINDMIESFNRKRVEQQKERAVFNNVLSNQILQGIASFFDKDTELMNVWDYFPELFENDKEQYLVDKEEEEFEKFKARRRAFAEKFNKEKG